jgi:imidazolonepropionase-like amidohydrolase
MFREEGLTITLGTDSLASNDHLSIFTEMLTLQEHFNIPVEELLCWATWNGACFLGVDDRYGCLEVGKRPGINLLAFKEVGGQVVLGETMKRLY